MPNLIERLDALSEAATPGMLELWTSCSFRRIKTADGKPYLVPSVAKDGVADLGSEANCAFLVELANAYRDGTLREALRDAGRLAYLTEDIADRGERAKRNQLLARMSAMSHSAACMAIDAAIAQERGDRLGRDGGVE